eukprot:jgi/Bigna1/79788/fgenesh1_pg.65_\
MGRRVWKRVPGIYPIALLIAFASKATSLPQRRHSESSEQYANEAQLPSLEGGADSQPFSINRKSNATKLRGFNNFEQADEVDNPKDTTQQRIDDSFRFHEVEAKPDKWPKLSFKYEDPSSPPKWLKLPSKIEPGLPVTKPPPVPNMIQPPYPWPMENSYGASSYAALVQGQTEPRQNIGSTGTPSRWIPWSAFYTSKGDSLK